MIPFIAPVITDLFGRNLKTGTIIFERDEMPGPGIDSIFMDLLSS
jgi:hypothetical protein